MSVHVVLSEIAGSIFEILVKPGNAVSEGDTLMLLDKGGPVAEGQAVAYIRGD